MDFSRRFELGLAWRVATAVGAGLLFGVSFRVEGLVAARLVAGALAVGAFWNLWHFVGQSNRAIARFVEALRYQDFAQRFSLGRGGGFERLGGALDAAIQQIGRQRTRAEDEVRYLSAVLDDSPVALLMIDEGDRVTPLNKVARRQFGTAPGIRIGDFERFGSEFMAALSVPSAGRRLTRLIEDGVPQRALVESARIGRIGKDQRVVSVLPVQNVLGSVEMAAQSDVVRVLTHEVMNSLTPVMSLARSAADLLAASGGRDTPELTEARLAIETVARRAEGLQHFVDGYRALSSVPTVRRRHFAAKPWVAEIVRLISADPQGKAAQIVTQVDETLSIDGDPELLAQLCLNLLRNAAAAAAGHTAEPFVEIRVLAGARGQTVIEVEDNGPGVPADRREDVFLPFYTTRPDGHGVGLSFVRQVATAHSGSVTVSGGKAGGALFRVLLL